jgi:hypothetical protein
MTLQFISHLTLSSVGIYLQLFFSLFFAQTIYSVFFFEPDARHLLSLLYFKLCFFNLALFFLKLHFCQPRRTS